ncbi:MAG: adenylate/guanylate cyclase domain-containing protein [Candidatus Riflebacteria bacterium]|nr:adenylate/guanylate cyclase domain-containing protein [Candidatus Riflebacteria bacterium]
MALIPALAFSHFTLKYADYAEEKALPQIQKMLVQDMETFDSLMNPTEILNHLITGFLADPHLSKADTAEKILPLSEKHLECKVAGVFFAKTNDRDSFSYYLHQDLEEDFGYVSASLMHSFLRALRNIEKNNEAKDTREDKRGYAHFQMKLSLLHLEYSLNKLIPVISGKTSIGRAYLYCLSDHLDTDESMTVLLIRDRDISDFMIMKNAMNMNNTRGIKRSIRQRKYPSTANVAVNRLFDNFLFNNDGTISLAAVPNSAFLRKRITANTFYPINLDAVSNKLPVLVVTASQELFENLLRKVFRILKVPLALVVLVSFFFLLKALSKENISERPLKSKVVLSAIFVSIFPFLIFALMYISYASHLEEENMRQLEKTAVNSLQQIDTALNTYVESKTAAMNAVFTNIVDSDKNETRRKLQNWLETNKGDWLFLVGKTDGTDYIEICKTKTSVSLSEYQKAIYTLLPKIILGRLRAESEGVPEDQMLEKYAFQFIKVESYIDNLGNLMTLHFLPPNFLSGYQESYNANDGMVDKIISVIFDSRKLLKEFAQQQEKELLFTISKGFHLKIALIPVVGSGDLASPETWITSKDFPALENLSKLEEVGAAQNKFSRVEGKKVEKIAYNKNLNILIAVFAETEKNGIGKILTQLAVFLLLYFPGSIALLYFIMNRTVVIPVTLLKDSAEKLSKGDLTTKADYKSGDAFEKLADAFNAMVKALREKEEMSAFLSDEALKEIKLLRQDELGAAAKKAEASIIFCSAVLPPDENVEIFVKDISSLIEVAGSCAEDFGGYIDKIIDDTVMMVFLKKSDDNSYAFDAANALLKLVAEYKKIRPEVQIKAGLASGEVISGNIGSSFGRLDFTVIGNAVNLASRLKGAAHKAKNTGIMICGWTIRLLKGAARVSFVDRVEIKGRTKRKFSLYELLELRTE